LSPAYVGHKYSISKTAHKRKIKTKTKRKQTNTQIYFIKKLVLPNKYIFVCSYVCVCLKLSRRFEASLTELAMRRALALSQGLSIALTAFLTKLMLLLSEGIRCAFLCNKRKRKKDGLKKAKRKKKKETKTISWRRDMSLFCKSHFQH